jgi:hypothetical protein
LSRTAKVELPWVIGLGRTSPFHNRLEKDRRRKQDLNGLTDPETSPENNDMTLQAQRWGELFNKLEHLRHNVRDQPCTAFAKWAPRIARYSFQSGRVLTSAR